MCRSLKLKLLNLNQRLIGLPGRGPRRAAAPRAPIDAAGAIRYYRPENEEAQFGGRMRTALRAALAVVAAAWALPCQAHHSFATQYDADKPVTLTGTVTKVEWTNPHARFYVNVADEAGEKVNWNLELASPNVLTRNGWSRHSLQEGDVVTVEGSMARSGALMANARTVRLADGSLVFARSPADQ